MFILFIGGILSSCASPGSMRKEGPTLMFTTASVTPQAFGRCLIKQLDEKFYNYVHSLRDNDDGNVTILTIAGGGNLLLMHDINKTNSGLNILIYGEPLKIPSFLERLHPLLTEALNACGAKQNISLMKKE